MLLSERFNEGYQGVAVVERVPVPDLHEKLLVVRIVPNSRDSAAVGSVVGNGLVCGWDPGNLLEGPRALQVEW